MDPDTVGRIEEWESQPVPAGHAGLRELELNEFSGAITNGSGWLFMLNGRIIGLFGGTIPAFDGVDLTAYLAPHPSLPLLFSMQETGGETQAKYYTDDTPLTEVDQTLTEGSFTGFIELSENVLSGDYYVVYYGGRSLSAAFIGNAEQLLTGDEAFQRANDEVGIYEVRSVDLEVHELPEADEEPATAGGLTDEPAPDEDEESIDSTDDAGEDAAAIDDTKAATPESDEEPETGDEIEGIEEAEPTVDEPAEDSVATASTPDDSSSEPGPDEEAHTANQPQRQPASDPSTGQPGREPQPQESRPNAAGRSGTSEASAPAQPDEPPEGSTEDPFSEEEAWRETRTIPALDPERSEAEAEPEGERAPQQPRRQPSSNQPSTPQQSQQRTRRQQAQPSQQGAREVEELRAAIESKEGRIEELETELKDLSAERDQLEDARDRIEEERDTLEERVDQLESQLETMSAKPDTADSGAVTTELDPDEALSQTDVFIRYGSKGQATLESAHGGRAEKEGVLSNLRLEEHTRFDADTATVNGRPYTDFLKDTLQYRFVKWLVEDLMFEIQDTNSQKRLRALYNVLPRFDRAEFDGSVTSRDDADEEHIETFDVVIRDRMGQPLIVADFNDDRDPASGDMMSDLVTRATAAVEGHDTIGSAFMVTASFFEPTALETADEATGGGLLDRDSKESFVKLGRKQGYHLCLAEARGDAFHVAVPEL